MVVSLPSPPDDLNRPLPVGDVGLYKGRNVLTIRKGNLPLPSDECRIISSAIQWEPYGGVPADEAWLGFGLGVAGFYHRLSEILDSRDLPDEYRGRIESLQRPTSHSVKESESSRSAR